MNQATLYSTSPTRVGILPVLDCGPPAGSTAPGGKVGAPFDTLLYPPPSVCPPPQENFVAERRRDLHPSPRSSDVTPAAEQPTSRDDRVEPASDEPLAEEQPAATAEEVTGVLTDVGGETTSTDDTEAAEALQAVHSLVALTGIAPPVVQGDSPAESDGEATAATAIEPAGDRTAPDTKQPALQAPSFAFDSEQHVAPSERPSEAAVDGITNVAAELPHADAQLELAEADDSNNVKNSADSDAKPVELKVDQQQEFFAVGEDSGSASKHHAESIAATNTDRSTNETAAARSSETAAPPVAAPEHSAAPVDSSRSMHSPGLPNPDAASGSVPRSRLPAAVSVLEPSTNQPAVQIDSVRLLQRVARAFHAAHQRDGEIQLRLSPAELGSLRLQVQVVEGALTARVEAENPAARAALIDNLPLLRERLHEQGVRIERFEVDLMQRHSSGGGLPDRPRDHDRSLPQLPPAATNARTAQPQPVRVAIPRTVGPGKLNVVV